MAVIEYDASDANRRGGLKMRVSLVMAVLSSFFFISGSPLLAADKEVAAGSAASVSSDKAADTAAAPTQSNPPSSDTSLIAPGSARNPEALPDKATKNSDEAPATGAPEPAESAAASAASMEPHKRPVPDGYAAAAEFFKQRKFAQAQKAFEEIVASGTADINTHLCLAHCYLQQKIYSKAVKEFEILSKYAKNSMSLQKGCAATATSLRNAMRGICPANCLKGHDPRWTLKAGSKVIQVPHNGGGYDTLTPNDIGHLIVHEHGNSVVKGICPVCEGTTEVPVLKDGGPMPRL